MPRIIEWNVEVSACSWADSGTIEVADDATDEDIDHEVREEVFNIVGWGWSERK
jgi:hypothetical protein